MTQQRDKKIQIRLTADELAAIDNLAKMAGKTRTAFLLDAALNQEVKLTYVDTEPLRDAMRKHSGIASNINQMAHRMNMRRQPPSDEIRMAMADAWKASMDVKRTLQDILEKLDGGGSRDDG